MLPGAAVRHVVAAGRTGRPRDADSRAPRVRRRAPGSAPARAFAGPVDPLPRAAVSIPGTAGRQARGGAGRRQPRAADAAPRGDPGAAGLPRPGWATGELAYELHGDAGTPPPSAPRMLRLRSLGRGGAVQPVPAGRGAWPDGPTRGGCRRSCARGGWPKRWNPPGPFLSRSGVLAVQLLRDQLDLAVGSAVRASATQAPDAPGSPRSMGSADAEAAGGPGSSLRVAGTRGTWRSARSVSGGGGRRQAAGGWRSRILAERARRGPQQVIDAVWGGGNLRVAVLVLR